MIQRIQTLYLFIASIISLGFTFLFPLWKDVAGVEYFAMNLLNVSEIAMMIIPILFILSGLISFVSVFLFKNRQHQFVISRLNILINLILLGVLIYHLLTLSGEAQVSEKGIGGALPIICIVFLILANKAIKKDEDLVKSVDRLR